MGRGIHQIWLVPEHCLGTVTVVHVEIHHRDALQPVHRACMCRSNGDAVEQTEAHGSFRLGMVSRRTASAECIRGLTDDHCIDSGANRARRPQCCLAGTGRHRSITVEAHQTAFRDRRQHPLHMSARVHAGDLLNRRLWRLTTVKPIERRDGKSRV